MAVVGFASPKTCGQSAKARFAVMTMPAAVAGPSIADKEVNYVAGAVHEARDIGHRHWTLLANRLAWHTSGSPELSMCGSCSVLPV